MPIGERNTAFVVAAHWNELEMRGDLKSGVIYIRLGSNMTFARIHKNLIEIIKKRGNEKVG